MQAEKEAIQFVAWEKQNKEIERQQDLIRRLAGGAQSGRASQAEKTLERIKSEGLIEKPFVAKKRSFAFPPVEKMGQKVRAWGFSPPCLPPCKARSAAMLQPRVLAVRYDLEVQLPACKTRILASDDERRRCCIAGAAAITDRWSLACRLLRSRA